MKRLSLVFFISILLFVSGCGYTTHSLLPSDFKSIRVDNFKNEIRITAEQSDQRMYVGYRPGMEIELTKAVIDAYLMDGNLKIARESNADIILTGALTDFKRNALRYDANDNVEEYRIELIVNIELENARTGALVWKETGFAGETTYRTSGSLAKSENAAIRAAIADLARRIVERTVEAW
ncbi:MAG: LPS assembly lipoprotein LptE [Candidatus Omnitrophota bacterium]